MTFSCYVTNPLKWVICVQWGDGSTNRLENTPVKRFLVWRTSYCCGWKRKWRLFDSLHRCCQESGFNAIIHPMYQTRFESLLSSHSHCCRQAVKVPAPLNSQQTRAASFAFLSGSCLPDPSPSCTVEPVMFIYIPNRWRFISPQLWLCPAAA